MTTIISHVKSSDKEKIIQTNEEHSQGVAELCEKFASEFGMGELGRVMGLLHDKGKEKKAFQEHIKKDSGLEPDIVVSGNSDHAYVGGLLAKRLFPTLYPLIANSLIGHHRGLYDYDECNKILNEETIPDEVKIPKITIDQLNRRNGEMLKRDVHNFIRMLFSCLVDADRLDTERFMDPDKAALRGAETSVDKLYPLLEKYLKRFDVKEGEKVSHVNEIRNYVRKKCEETSQGPKGFYSLTVPTGGGKTLSSITWAIKHAMRNGQRRIIIAIPYTSIIVQTAAVLREIFGKENVLEHHSNIQVDDSMSGQEKEKLKLATENWDYPIIVTTNVQLFESLYSNKPSDCRKLHNIVNSVLILDEVQTLPLEYLKPITGILDSLVRCFGVSVLFTTASQPILSGNIRGASFSSEFKALDSIREIIPAEAKLHKELKRVDLEFETEAKTYDEIAAEVSENSRVLCIVNTRKDAKEIYDKLPKEGERIHLSRMMCPDHIRETIERIRTDLKNSDKKIIRVVSTQLIEAGVDIDFDVVFRQEAGLDSILQAAGRCNREGHLKCGHTHVFSLAGENRLPPGYISNANNARLGMDPNKEWDWFSPEAMNEYFRQLYSRTKNFDIKDIARELYFPWNFEFETAANDFKLIQDDSVSIIVNWKNSPDLVNKLKAEGASYPLMKELAQYSVDVSKTDFNKLCNIGIVETISDDIFYIPSDKFYSPEIGLKTDNIFLNEILIK